MLTKRILFCSQFCRTFSVIYCIAMEAGSCFRNYEDFKESFIAFKKETKYHYGLKNCISVRFYNRKHGANIREDITFMQVRFNCIQTQGQNKKRKSLPSACPAYFVLQYNEELDRLVISEQNSNHVHANSENPSVQNCSSPSARTAINIPPASPPQKRWKENPNPLSENAAEKQASAGSAIPLTEANAALEMPKPATSGNALMRVAEVMKNFLRVDMGSMASISAGSSQDLNRLSFQTSKMRGLFIKFPESLLLHRVQSEYGHVLYAFLVESKERVGKVVHFAVLKEDTVENVAKMLKVFCEFNPEWPKIKVVFTDTSFLHSMVLKESFPSAQVLLSVYHTVRLIERKAKEAAAFRESLAVALRDVVFSTSSVNLLLLAEMLKPVLEPEFHDYLQANWFSCEMLWYMHVKKGRHSCSTYIDSLELITHKIVSLFSRQTSLETIILHFVEYADCFNTKSLENLYRGFSSITKESPKSSLRSSKASTSDSMPFRFLPLPQTATQPLSKKLESVSPKLLEVVSPMLVALKNICTELGYQMCKNEWEVVQKSTQLINIQKTNISVQLLEDTHQVSSNCQSCSCCFYSRYRLPCRHILSVLHANKRPLEVAMVNRCWQQKYHRHLVEEEDLLDQVRCSVECLMAEERCTKIKNLSRELANLLQQCEGAEFAERCSTLQMIVDIWNKPSEQAEEDEAARVVENIGDLPFLWVKQEASEAEEMDIILEDLLVANSQSLPS
ncbi:zinc finger SWIM domain-containing protein 3 isoform X2 [Rhinatrema bivittatum]|uniref:zinc finger SWIM domain-containing protein 3 isoform X2 n=1 Tax=Rhinatrema bivittatum TaxID=194408 RepID=UPI001129053B|nr:zinc finger SWIM domain-containing protein 3 isoform X2 [Rhinatrema bivittatum]